MPQDFFLLNNDDATVIAELQRRQVVKENRGARDDGQAPEEDQQDIEKWKNLHMSLAQQRKYLSASSRHIQSRHVIRDK